MYTIVDGQMQCQCISTSVNISADIIVITGSEISSTIPIPGERSTCSSSSICMHAIVDGQMQCQCIGTAVNISADIIIVTGSEISSTIPIPGERSTCSSGSIRMHTIVDGQMQCQRIGTAVNVSADIIVIRAEEHTSELQ